MVFRNEEWQEYFSRLANWEQQVVTEAIMAFCKHMVTIHRMDDLYEAVVEDKSELFWT